jgi:hypothetical protein
MSKSNTITYRVKPGIMSIDKTILKTVYVDDNGIHFWLDGFEYSAYMHILDFTNYNPVDNNLLH